MTKPNITPTPSNGNTISSLIKTIVYLGIIVLMVSGGIFIAIATLAALIVPATWLWGAITGQSYERVCDNSEIIYQLNNIGKWTWVVYVGVIFLYILFKII